IAPHVRATGSRNSRRHTVSQKLRDAGRRPLRGSAAMAIGSADVIVVIEPAFLSLTSSRSLNSGVDGRLGEIHDQIDRYEKHRQDEDGALQDGQVALEDRIVEKEARARPREDGLDEDGSAKDLRELQAHNGEHG